MYMEAHMIRFLLVCITVIGFLILSIPILIVEWIIGKFNPYKKDISSLHLIQSVFRFILWLTGVEVTVIGEELVPTDEAVLYIGNHRSFFDILLTYTRCPRLTGYIAKAEMEKIPLLSNWMHYLHCLFLDRKDIKQGLKTILTAVDKVKSGISICIFPEGIQGDSLRILMNAVLEKNRKLCAVFSGNDAAGYRYVIGSRDVDVRNMAKELNAAFEGRGGGRPEMVQGTVRGTEEELQNWILRKAEEL